MTRPETAALPSTAPRLGTWVAAAVAAWHLAFFATGTVTLTLASSPAGSVFEGLAEPVHHQLMLSSHLRVLAGYAVVALGALLLAYPLVRLWSGNRPTSRWGIIARTLLVLAVFTAHGWLRLIHSQPYFLGPTTYDTWYFQLLSGWSEEVRERLWFLLFVFVPAVVVVGAIGVYLVDAARWLSTGGKMARLTVASTGMAALLLSGWMAAPHFIQEPRQPKDDRWNVIMLTSAEVSVPAGSPGSASERPVLSSLAAESIVFSNMRSPLPTGLGEALSVHTSQAPHSHGLQTPHPSKEQVACALAQAPSLPALLSRQGYSTAVFGDEAAGPYALADGLGFSDVIAGVPGAYPRHLAGLIYPAHLIIPAWLDNKLGRRLLPDLSVLPDHVDAETVTARLTARLEEDAASSSPFFLQGVYARPQPPDPKTGRTTSTFDAQLAQVLECLEENDLRDRTLLVVLGRSAENETWNPSPPSDPASPLTDTPVPVILHVPDQSLAPGTLPHLTRLIDLAPTLLDLLNLPAHPAMQGVSLRAVLENPSQPLPLLAFGESAGFPESLPNPETGAPVPAAFRDAVRLDPASGYRFVLKDEYAALRRKQRWVRTASWQLVFTPAEISPNQVDQWQLFDLRADPLAKRDVKLQNPQVWQALERALRRWADEKQESSTTDVFPGGEPTAAVLPGT